MGIKRIVNSLIVVAWAAGASAGNALPDVFPINMGFKSLLSTTNDPNHAFDTLANAGRYAIHHGNVSNMDLIKTNFPNVVTIAMNPRSVDGENRSSASDKANTGNVWPGFWLYKTGSLVAANLSASSTTIPVASTNYFGLPPQADMVIIYARNPDNTPDWNHYEYAQVTNIIAGAIQVKRGATGTTAKSFTNGQAVVAHVMSAWITGPGDMLFKHNLSLDCPRNPTTGENAAEFWARGEAASLNAGLNNGTEHDVVYCYAGEDADVDNDLQPDGGFKDGVNIWNLGFQENVRLVREGAGPDTIMQYDCIRARNGYRGWKYVNGIQMETFQGGDHFSEAYDLLSQWVEHAEAKPAFSYGFCKTPTTTYGGVVPDQDWMFRKQFATGLMVGMPHPYAMGTSFGIYDWDEQRGGNLDDYAWLGKALGPPQRDLIDLNPTNLLAADTWNVLVASNYSATSSGSVNDTNGVEIAVTQLPANQGTDYDGVKLKLNRDFLLVAGKEYTLTFDAKADDTVVYRGETYPDLPVYIQVTEYGTTTGKMGVLATRNWRTYRLGFVCAPNRHFRVEFGVAEAIGTVWLKNIKLQEGCVERLSRDFENGTVFLNESETTDWVVDLGTNQYWRLKGDIRPDINDGGVVGGSITVPFRDAVYLLKRDPLLRRLIASAGNNGTVSPASTNVPPGGSAIFTVAADGYYRIAALATNGIPVASLSFDNNSTSMDFTWGNVQRDGVLTATFAPQAASDPASTPYWWLAQYGLTNFDADAVADADSDGLLSWQEYVAGTDPTNPASVFKITGNVATPQGEVVRWPSVSNRFYNLDWTTNLPATPPENVYTNTWPAGNSVFYSISIQQ